MAAKKIVISIMENNLYFDLFFGFWQRYFLTDFVVYWDQHRFVLRAIQPTMHVHRQILGDDRKVFSRLNGIGSGNVVGSTFTGTLQVVDFGFGCGA